MSGEMDTEDDSSNSSIDSVILAVKKYYPNAQVDIVVNSNNNKSSSVATVFTSSPKNKNDKQIQNDIFLGAYSLVENSNLFPDINNPSCSTQEDSFTLLPTLKEIKHLDQSNTVSKECSLDEVNPDESNLALFSQTIELEGSDLNFTALELLDNSPVQNNTGPNGVMPCHSDHCYTPLKTRPSDKKGDDPDDPDWVPSPESLKQCDPDVADENNIDGPSCSTGRNGVASCHLDHCYTPLKNRPSDNKKDDPDDPDWVPSPESPDLITDTDVARLNNASEEELSLGKLKKERKRKIHSDMSEWNDFKNKKLRETGKGYIGWYRPKDKKAKRGVERKSREIGPQCVSKACEKSQHRQCQDIDENERKELFNYFWTKLNWDQKKLYIPSLVNKSEKNDTKKKAGEESRRRFTYTYTIKKPDGQIIKVCKKMFLNTFGLKEWAVLNWVSTTEKHGMSCSKEIINKTRKESKPNRPGEGKIVLENFIDSLPKLPSHYCRQNTQKIYLEPTGVSNMSDIYNEYKRLCETKEGGPVKPVSRFTFDLVISEKKISFQPPKKDRCDTCISYEEKQLSEQKYNEHIARKEAAREEKNKDKSLGADGKCIVLTQDLQSVKVCPSLNASALYYKTKLLCHNFTILDNNTLRARCFWFDESQSDLTANTFANCVLDFLNDVCVDNKPVIIWSDGCTAQNRNAIFSNALLSFSHEKNIEITQKFLEKGHTQMEVDSVHATIERKLKNKPIHLPSDYIRYTSEARKIQEYETKALTFDFFKNFSKKGLMVYDSIRPGKKTGDPTVMDIKAIKYLPGGVIKIKLSFSEDFVDIPQRKILDVPPKLSSFPQLHNATLPISKTKWQHLQDLKFVLPRDCHAFYDSLKYETQAPNIAGPPLKKTLGQRQPKKQLGLKRKN